MSSTAYDAVLDRFELRERLDLLLKDVDVNNLDDLAGKSMCVLFIFHPHQNPLTITIRSIFFGTQIVDVSMHSPPHHWIHALLLLLLTC